MSEHGFTEQISKQFLNKQWFVKIDNDTTRSYLFKYLSTPENQCLLVTDTIRVWYEVLELRYLIRRWRPLNNGNPPRSLESDEESIWRTKIAQNLSNIHTPSAIQESTFSIEQSHEADLVIEVRNLDFGIWRWECYQLGFKASAQILSDHLISPLISVTNLAFTSADPICELSTSDLEEAVDKTAKAGRRTQAIFVRQTISRPKVATTIARLSAMWNFMDSIPSIQETVYEGLDRIDTSNGTTTKAQSSSHVDETSVQPTADEEPINVPDTNTSKRKYQSSPSSPQNKRLNSNNHDGGSTTEPDTDDGDDGPSVKVQKSLPGDVITETQARNVVDERENRSPISAARRDKSSSPSITQNGPAVNSMQSTTSASINQAIRRAGVSVKQPVKRGGKRF